MFKSNKIALVLIVSMIFGLFAHTVEAAKFKNILKSVNLKVLPK